MFKIRNLAKYTIAPLVAIVLGAMIVIPADAGMTSSVRPNSSFSGGSRPSAPSYSKPYIPAPVDRPAAVYSKPTPAFTPPIVADKPPTSSGYSKPAPIASATPAFTPPIVADKPPTSSGYSKPGAVAPAPIASAAPTPKTYTPHVVDTKSVLSATSSRVMGNDALKAYQAERAASKTPPPQPVDVGALKRDSGFAAARSRYASVDSYMFARTTNITIYRNAHPNVYIYSSRMSPNYGAYDSGFLVGLMLGEIGTSEANTAWMYAHQYDPWYEQWHADMMRQAQDDAALRARIDAQDAELAKLKSMGTNPNPQVALPPGVDASVAIAPEAMIAQANVLQEASESSEASEDSESPILRSIRNIMIILTLVVGVVLVFSHFASRKK